MPAVLEHVALRQFKSQEDAASNLNGVFDGLEAGGKFGPILVAKIGVSCSRAQDEVVVTNGRSTGQVEVSRAGINSNDLIHQDFGVGILADDGPDRLCDLGRGEDCESHLIKEWLKGMVISAVDNGYVYGQFTQSHGRIDACKTTSNDGYSGPWS